MKQTQKSYNDKSVWEPQPRLNAIFKKKLFFDRFITLGLS